MADREKVIKGLECCSDTEYDCALQNECPYSSNYGEGCMLEMKKDALSLLKAQEPVEPERAHSGGGSTWWNVCGICKTAINPNDKFCHECGREVLWRERG